MCEMKLTSHSRDHCTLFWEETKRKTDVNDVKTLWGSIKNILWCHCSCVTGNSSARQRQAGLLINLSYYNRLHVAFKRNKGTLHQDRTVYINYFFIPADTSNIYLQISLYEAIINAYFGGYGNYDFGGRLLSS